MDSKLQTVFKLLWGPLGNMHNISNRTLISELWLLLKHVDKKHKEVNFMKDFIMSSIALIIPLHLTNFTHSSNNLTLISQPSISTIYSINTDESLEAILLKVVPSSGSYSF